MKITITIEGPQGHLTDSWKFEDDVNFPTQMTDMNEEINAMIEYINHETD